jgi:atypical dual specificity phosphatase
LLWPEGNEWFAIVPFVLMATKGVDVTIVNGLFLSALWITYTLFITSPLYFFLGRYLVLMIYLPIIGVVFYKEPHQPATRTFMLLLTVFWDYPLMIWMRLISRMNGRALKPFYSTITDAVAMGSMPLPIDAKYLKHEKNIGLVVNMCREYAGPLKEYSELGITQLHLPTPDVCEPDYCDMLLGVNTIIEHIEKHRQSSDSSAAAEELLGAEPGDDVSSTQDLTTSATSTDSSIPTTTTTTTTQTAPAVTSRVFIHCKAGRGRAATLTLCYLLATTRLSPKEAIKHILSRRHVVEPSVQNFKVVQKFVQRLKYYDNDFETLFMHDYVLNIDRQK